MHFEIRGISVITDNFSYDILSFFLSAGGAVSSFACLTYRNYKNTDRGKKNGRFFFRLLLAEASRRKASADWGTSANQASILVNFFALRLLFVSEATRLAWAKCTGSRMRN